MAFSAQIINVEEMGGDVTARTKGVCEEGTRENAQRVTYKRKAWDRSIEVTCENKGRVRRGDKRERTMRTPSYKVQEV